MRRNRRALTGPEQEVSAKLGIVAPAISLHHGQALLPAPASTPPVAVSRGRGVGGGVRGGRIIIREFPAAQLRPPSPE